MPQCRNTEADEVEVNAFEHSVHGTGGKVLTSSVSPLAGDVAIHIPLQGKAKKRVSRLRSLVLSQNCLLTKAETHIILNNKKCTCTRCLNYHDLLNGSLFLSYFEY